MGTTEQNAGDKLDTDDGAASDREPKAQLFPGYRIRADQPLDPDLPTSSCLRFSGPCSNPQLHAPLAHGRHRNIALESGAIDLNSGCLFPASHLFRLSDVSFTSHRRLSKYAIFSGRFDLIPPFAMFITSCTTNLGNDIPCSGPVLHLRSIPHAILQEQVKAQVDVEAQAEGTIAYVGETLSEPPAASLSSGTHTSFLVGLGCLAAINIIFLMDVELSLLRNDSRSDDDQSGLGQVLALLLLVVLIRDFVSSIVGIRKKLWEPDKYAEERTHRFQDALQNAIEANRVDGGRFKALIKRGAHLDTQIQGFILFLSREDSADGAITQTLSSSSNSRDVRAIVVGMAKILQTAGDNVRRDNLEGLSRLAELGMPSP
ncbi:hypothetical protein K438DRAFT_1991914 [Mycena galopus ATCC 62051]|nr:hypothetical protein K438DRAFT_1991914 [Mycena galopus ATCC 62051]